MAKKNGAQSVEVIPGRKIVLSSGVGKTNIDELKWLTETVLSEAKLWKSGGWAYIADCSQMDPVSPVPVSVGVYGRLWRERAGEYRRGLRGAGGDRTFCRAVVLRTQRSMGGDLL